MGIHAITTKTGTKKYSETTQSTMIKVCDITNSCCSTTLDRNGRNFKAGATNVFDQPQQLGECHDVMLDYTDELTVTMSKMGSDGWFVDWVDVTLPHDVTFHCVFRMWLDDSTGYSLSSDPVKCQRS